MYSKNTWKSLRVMFFESTIKKKEEHINKKDCFMKTIEWGNQMHNINILLQKKKTFEIYF